MRTATANKLSGTVALLLFSPLRYPYLPTHLAVEVGLLLPSFPSA